MTRWSYKAFKLWHSRDPDDACQPPPRSGGASVSGTGGDVATPLKNRLESAFDRIRVLLAPTRKCPSAITHDPVSPPATPGPILFLLTNKCNFDNYIEELRAHLDTPSVVVAPCWKNMPRWSALAQLPRTFVERKIHETRTSYISRARKFSWAKTIEHRILARWHFAADVRVLARHSPAIVVVWNGMKFRRSIFVEAAKSVGAKVVYLENGLLPNTTVCDPKGINMMNSVPRDVGFYLSLREQYPEKPITLDTRETKHRKKPSCRELPAKYIFVPFQADHDTQVIIFSKWITSMRQLFDEVLAAAGDHSDYKIVFKEHPSSDVDYGDLHDLLTENRGMFANDLSTQELIEKAESVITINSTVGIEALLFGRKVIVLGNAFYALPGLVMSANNRGELKNAIDKLDTFAPDEQLRKNFLYFLEHRYLVKGSWRHADESHYRQMANRLEWIATHQELPGT